MILIQTIILIISKFAISKSESTTGQCDRQMRMVQSKYISEEILDSRTGITNGEPFLASYFNSSRFVIDSDTNCAKACFKHPDCLGILVTDVCELGLTSGYEGRRINASSEADKIMVRMDALVRFIEDNKAFNKTAFSSSVLYARIPSEAVNGDFSRSECAITQEGANEWWAVDLENTFAVHGVSVVNVDNYRGDWLSDFDITVSLDNPNPLEAINTSLCTHFAGPVRRAEHKYIKCDVPVIGRYLSISLSGTLILCEVEVFGVKI